jgi:acyl-CoA thioester hydrolase
LAEKNNSTDSSGGGAFRWPIRVYYEDTDVGGVVYHGNYVRFFERARTEHLRALGLELHTLREREDILFVIRAMELDFRKPARFNDSLWVTSEIEQIRSASIFFRQAVFRGESELLCEARVQVVCLAAEAFRPKPVPDFMLQRLRG